MSDTPSRALTPGIHVVSASSLGASLPTVLSGITHLHASCILHDGTLATFLPPLSHATMYAWWEARMDEVSRGHRHMIVSLSPVTQRTGQVAAPWADDWPLLKTPSPSPSSSSEDRDPDPGLRLEVSGVVSLATPVSQTGPFRALVEKLFVSPLHRRQGVARKMMVRLESVALHLGRWNLMLDTEVGSDAENVYPRLGYTRLGVVPEYGYSPRDGRLVDEVWFWKDLRKARLG